MYGHKFVQQQFYNIMRCALCGELLKYSAGMQCSDCKYTCHKKCYPKVVMKCISKSNSDPSPDEEKLNHRIPHRFEPTTNLGANWCCHCGYMLPVGKKNARKCTGKTPKFNKNSNNADTDDYRMRTHLPHTVHASCPGLLWDVYGSCQYNFSRTSVEEAGSTPKEACFNDGSYAALATRQPSIYRRRATGKSDPAFLCFCHAVRTSKCRCIRCILPDWCHPSITNQHDPHPAIPASAAIYSSATPAEDRFRCGRGGCHAGTIAARFNRSIRLLPASSRFPSSSRIGLCPASEC
jgi:hypothetical protein